jgi:hypothetical protein
VADVDAGRVQLWSRHQRSLTRYFPEVVDALRAWFGGQVTLDGELIVSTGYPDDPSGGTRPGSCRSARTCTPPTCEPRPHRIVIVGRTRAVLTFRDQGGDRRGRS